MFISWKEDPARLEHADDLGQRRPLLVLVRDVVERVDGVDEVEAGVGERQLPGARHRQTAGRSGRPGPLRRSGRLPRSAVDAHHRAAGLGHPRQVPSLAAAQVEAPAAGAAQLTQAFPEQSDLAAEQAVTNPVRKLLVVALRELLEVVPLPAGAVEVGQPAAEDDQPGDADREDEPDRPHAEEPRAGNRVEQRDAVLLQADDHGRAADAQAGRGAGQHPEDRAPGKDLDAGAEREVEAGGEPQGEQPESGQKADDERRQNGRDDGAGLRKGERRVAGSRRTAYAPSQTAAATVT